MADGEVCVLTSVETLRLLHEEEFQCPLYQEIRTETAGED